MVRGVNKNIIEISDTGNDCFERAILFVRAEHMHRDDDAIRRRAMNYLSGIKFRPWMHPRWRWTYLLLSWVGAALLGALVTALILIL